MIPRFPFTVMALAAVLLGAMPAPSAAGTPSKDDARDVSQTDAPERRSAEPLDRLTIYRILCGGESADEPALSRHLWRIAGSLASDGWTPPRVTIRVVVSNASGQ